MDVVNPASAGLVTCSSPELFQWQTKEQPSSHKTSRDGAGVRERSHNRLQTMTLYQKTVAAAFGGVAVLFAPATAVAIFVAAPVPAQAEETFRQFEQSPQFEQTYCFTTNFADRWKGGCR